MEIQDFGEKIGGAKKDLWKDRGLSVDDLVYMNNAEKTKFVKKDNVWKKPDYQELVNNGLSTRVVYFIKTIRDATPTKPEIHYMDDVSEKQENYISFVSKLRDFVMNIKEDNEILSFYDSFLSNYIIKSPYNYTVRISPEVSGCINNKLLKASQIRRLNEIDSGIKKTQFLYTDDEKILSNFEIYVYDNKDIKFSKDYRDTYTIEIPIGFGKRFIYPKNELSNPENWKENTIFITRGTTIIKNNLESIDEAERYILDNFKLKQKETQSRKKSFKPKQLEHIIRDGEDYRNNKDITGEDMMEKFDFKGGEFGNWLNEKDRQESLNYGYDALLDLSKALNILPTDISLGNRLSIAFGSRGSGNALAHYEPDREVINLTKMKGAGSLAHEWAHALDDIFGKELGYRGFLTEHSPSKVVRELIEAMKYKTVCNDKTIEKQTKRYEARINELKNYINMFFPKEHLSEEQMTLKDKLIQNVIDNSETISTDLLNYVSGGRKINSDVMELSKLRKETVGRMIPKEERERICYMQNNLFNAKNNIGKPEKVDTEFYKNSKTFDDLYSKTSHGYWQSTVEMFARSFACFVKYKLDNRSDYLCGHAEMDLGLDANDNGDIELIKAFPEGEERTLINEKIDRLIEILKEKALLHDCRTQEINNEFDYEY